MGEPFQGACDFGNYTPDISLSRRGHYPSAFFTAKGAVHDGWGADNEK